MMQNPKLDELLTALEPYGLRQTGTSEWRSRCPGHDGENPTSLKISHDDQTGKIGLTCFSQDCTADDILRPLGMEAKDLYMPQKMTPELRKRVAEKKAQAQADIERARVRDSYTAVTLGLIDDYDPGTKRTDRANAQRFINQHGYKARYCSQLGFTYSPKNWFIWDGMRWKQDDTDHVFRLGDQVRESVDYIVAKEEDDERRRTLRQVAASLETKSKMQNMIETASKFLPIRLEDLDQDPWVLNVENGTIDLRTGELLPHDPERFITKLCPVEYDSEAKSPLFLSFLERIFNGNQNLIRFTQKALGYALTGSTREQVVFFLYGAGANGKSTLLDTVQAMLGDYAMNTPTSTLMSKRSEGVPNDIARLKGARFVSATEAEEGKRLSEPLIKQLSGGDIITARFMRAEWFEYKPEFKLFFATNYKPVIRGTDHAIWRRIRLIPFSVVIPKDEQDPELSSKLLEELPGILAWAVEGCLLWQEEGLGLPEEVAKATDAYRVEMDVLAGFIEDCCVLNPLAKVAKGEFYQEYCLWCEENGERPLSQRRLGTRMIDRGFTEIRVGSNRTRHWEGIGLKTDTTDTTDTKNHIRKNNTVSHIANGKSVSVTSVTSAVEAAPTKEVDEIEL